jgi:hypothetical protein
LAESAKYASLNPVSGMKCATVTKRSKYHRLALLTNRSSRNFRIFYVGYLTSLLGSAMSRIAPA